MRFALPLAAAHLLALSLGCAAPQLAGGQKVLKFHARDDEAFADAPRTGHYVVAYRAAGTDELWPADGTRRKVRRGDPLGFTHDDAGQVVAVAGAHEKVVGQIPVVALYACWYRLPDGYDLRQSTANVLRDAPKVAVLVALVGAVVALDLALLSVDHDGHYDDDGWSDHPPKRWHKHRHDR